jgi:hypothetical protein
MTNFLHGLRQRLRGSRAHDRSRPTAAQKSRQFVFEPLEPRLLMSADPVFGGSMAVEPVVIAPAEPTVIGAALLDNSSPVTMAIQQEPARTGSAAAEQAQARHEIVFVDTSVDAYEQLLGDLLAQNSNDRWIEVRILDAQRDGIEQVSEVLAGYSELDAVHFISHGTTGAVQLGATWLDINSLQAVADSIAGWGAALRENADLLFYGCNVAASEEGRVLLSALSNLTRADVAGSVDPTGSTALGGDLDLEFTVGTIDAVVAVNFGIQQSWSGLLNSAPVLDNTKSPMLTAINEDAGAPSGAVGTLVSQLVDFASPSGQVDNITDPDAGALVGIAITAADTTNGTWWYSTNNGTNWLALGAVNDGNARLLAADGSTRLYFQPNANYNGTMAAAITFHAWDQTSGTAGGTAALDITGTVLDQFSSVSYDNNNGTTNWTGNWVENDSNGGGVSGGRIQIDSGRLDIRADAIGDWIYREANLSGGTSATLSLDYNNNLGGGDSIVIQVSNNGGASYSTLSGGTFSSSLNTGSGTLSFDITPFISANTRVRFYVTTESANEHLYLDNVQISYSNTGGTTAFSTTSDTASLTVNPVNDSPTASNMSTAETYTLDTPLNLADIVISDVDSANVTATLTLSDPGAGSLNTATSGSVTSTYNAVTAVWRASGAIADVNTLLANLTYTPTLLYLLPFTIDTSVDDGVAPAITGSKSMTVALVNLPPAATNLNAAETYTEDTALNLTNIVVTDLDSPNVTATLTLSDSAAGSLSTASSGSVTSTYNAATGVWTASGAIADVNALLASVTFTPSLNYNSNFTIATSVDDGVAPAITGVKSVTGIAVNDAPSATNLNTGESYTEDTPLNLTDIVITDVDSANVTATLTLSDSAAGSLNTATSGSVTSIYNAATGVWTASGAIADVNTLLAGVTFAPALNYNSNFTIATSVDDGVAPALTGVKNMVGTAQNDAPVLTNNSLTITEGGSVVLSGADLSATDIDDAAAGVNFTVSGVSGGQFELVASPGVAITSFTQAQVSGGEVRFLHDGGEAAPSYDVTVSDAVLSDGPATATISFINQNDSPTATNLNTAESYTEDTPLNLTNIVISDVDSANVTVSLTLSDSAAGTLNTATSGSVTSTYNAVTGVWTASGAIVNVNTLLAGVTFNPAVDYNSNFTIATSVDDGVAPAITGVKSMTGIAVNDSPTATNLNAAESYTEDTALNLTDIVVSDVDSANVTVTLALSDSAAGSLNTGTSGAVTSTYNAATGVWTASGAKADVNALLAGVTFTPASNYNSNFTIATSVDDGVAAPITGVKNMTAIAVNDAPTATNLNAAESYTEDTPVNLTNIVIGDVDSANVTVTLTLSDSAAGSLSTGTSGSVTSTYNAAMGVWSASGAIADVNVLLAGVTFAPALNYNSDFTIATSMDDGIAAPITGVKNMIATAQNDAPVLTNNTLIITEGGSMVLFSTKLSATDVDNATASLTFTVSSVTGGRFELVSSPGTAITTFTQAQVSGGEVRFVHDGGEAAPSYDVTVSDAVLSDGPATATISFTNQNDAPVLSNNRLSITQGDSVVLSGTSLSATDVDNATASLTFTVSSVTGGRFELVSSPGTAITTFTQAQVSGGEVRFVHDGGEAAPSYDVTVSDGALSAGPAAAIINFTNLDDTMEPTTPPTVPGTAGPGPVEVPIIGTGGLTPVDNPGPTTGTVSPGSGGTENSDSSSVESEILSGEFPSAVNNTDILEIGIFGRSSSSKVSDRPSSEIREGISTRSDAPLVTPNSDLEDTTLATLDRADLGSVIDVRGFVKAMDELREDVHEETNLDKVVVGSALTLTTGFSIGYVLWLVRGEVLLTSLLASLPAWRLIDPLPVLSFLNRRSDGDDDDDSIEAAVRKSGEMPQSVPVPKEQGGTRSVKWRVVMQPADSIQENSL